VKNDVLNVKNLPNSKEKPECSDCAYIDEDITSMRRVVAERLTKSKQETPHFYINISANVSELVDLRTKINSAVGKKILIDAFIAKATAMAMQNFPEINSSWINGKIRRYKNIDISIAVAIEGGVMTPIIRNCDSKSVKDISSEIRELADRAKVGGLKSHEFSGGGITISNLGMFNIDGFLAIINPPQGSILSIGPSKKPPIYNDNDELIPALMMNIGHAIDHRVTDGAVAAKFLCNVVRYLENPISLLVV
jgi:pyruvate dehydrogenase E2 component (dihydrolipoamide acetyltransferase)